MSKRVWKVVVPALLIAAVAAVADWEPGQARERMQERRAKVDKNNDGQITAEEVGGAYPEGRDQRIQMFNAFDTDHDGRVAKAEYPNADRFNKADVNNDGYLTTNEFLFAHAKGTAQRLDRVDSNDDGVFSEEEIQKAAERRMKNRKKLR